MAAADRAAPAVAAAPEARPEAGTEEAAGSKDSGAAPRSPPAPKFKVAEVPLNPQDFEVVELQVEGLQGKVVAAALVRVLPDVVAAADAPLPTPSAVVAAAPASPPAPPASAAANGGSAAAVRRELAEIERELPQLEAAVAAVQRVEPGAATAAALERDLQVGCPPTAA